MSENVDDVVAARIAAARLRIEATRKRRAAMEAARTKGLARRHAAKLRHQADPRPGVATPEPAEGEPVTERTHTSGPVTAAADDIRDHGYAIVQTRIERVPARYRRTKCGQPDGCNQTATLMTLALTEVVFDGPEAVGFRFARDDAGEIVHFPVCDGHRCDASHVLFYALTGRFRPDGIRAFDVLGQHMDWA
jgi:hypothetical protein